MFILLNGSFGIGKTTVADLLAGQIEGLAVFDPESIGYVLRRLPAFMVGRARQPSDYQDLLLWRRLIVWGALWKHFQASTVIVPMAFSNLNYLDSFAKGLEQRAPVLRLCLVSPLEVIQARLQYRAAAAHATVTAFERTRSRQCVEAHRDPAFGTPVDATGTPEETAAIIRRIALA